MPEHCCVPLCSASAKFNGILSFHAFPTHSDLRRQWLVNIRRDHFTITSHTRVCCRHFASDQLIEMERRPELVPPDDQEEHSLTRDHDYCSVPEPSALDISASAAEDLSEDVETLRKEIQELRVQREFGLQRFAGSDTDIRFYTREELNSLMACGTKEFLSLLVLVLGRSNLSLNRLFWLFMAVCYDHLMAFWVLIEPCIYKMIRVSRAKLTPARTSTVGYGFVGS
uniref:THAP domain-containing protein 1 n=1 Tax=Astatotilapia calliptera TaxID=8154 RepID=A0A3P8RAD7_ASTCA